MDLLGRLDPEIAEVFPHLPPRPRRGPPPGLQPMTRSASGYQWINAENSAYAEEMGRHSYPDPPHKPFPPHYSAARHTGMRKVKLE